MADLSSLIDEAAVIAGAEFLPQWASSQCIAVLQAQIQALCDQLEAVQPPSIDCAPFCPVVVAGTDGVDSPINLNPAALTPITWDGWQSNEDSVVEASGANVTLLTDDVCAVHIAASVTFVNTTGDSTGNAQRAHPELWLLKNGQKFARADIYIRDANGQDADTAVINKYDYINPVAGTVYSLAVERDSTQSPATGQSTGTLEAYTDVEIANYIEVAVHRRFDLCSVNGDSTPSQGQTIEDDGSLSWSNNAPTCQININSSAVGNNIHTLATVGTNGVITLTFNGGTANGLTITVPANSVQQSAPNPTSYFMSYACPTAPGGNTNVTFDSVTIS